LTLISYEELNINTSANPSKTNFSFNIDDVDMSKYKLVIEVTDVHNNALVVDDNDSTILEKGIYLKAKNKFYTGAIVPNYRYQFAIKFVVSKPTDLVLDVNALLAEGVVLLPGEDISLDLKNSKLYLIEDNKLKNLSEQFTMLDNNKKAIYKINEVESGKEYLLVFDFKLKSLSNKVKNINVKVSLGHVFNNMSIPVVAEPKVD
jgi:hypothetical protein